MSETETEHDMCCVFRPCCRAVLLVLTGFHSCSVNDSIAWEVMPKKKPRVSTREIRAEAFEDVLYAH